MKSAAGLAGYAKAQLGRPYWWGTFGQTADGNLLAQKRRQYPSQYGEWDYEKDFGKKVHDCCGLIKGYLWCDGPDGKPGYVPSQDVGVSGLYANCRRKGGMATMPDEAGVLVFREGLGHVGVYIGSGQVVEAMGKRWGVQKTELSRRNWAYWGKLDWLDYSAAPDAPEAQPHPQPSQRPAPVYYYNVRLGLLKSGMEDAQITALQQLLNAKGHACPVNGIMDDATVQAVRDFQKKAAILCDGEVGGETWIKLLRG